MRNANSASGNGDSDQVIVPMMSLIIKGKKKGPVDTTTAGSGREGHFLRKGYRRQTSFLYGDEGKEPNKRTVDKPYSNGNPPEARACVYNEVAGRGGAIVEALCLKPERRNLKFRNFRGGAGKRIGLIRPDGTSGLNSGKSNHCVCLLLDRQVMNKFFPETRINSGPNASEPNLAGPRGFEPPTYGLRVHRST